MKPAGEACEAMREDCIASELRDELEAFGLIDAPNDETSEDLFGILDKVCHTSERKDGATVYTLADSRFPEYSGRRISVRLVFGKDIAEWATDDAARVEKGEARCENL